MASAYDRQIDLLAHLLDTRDLGERTISEIIENPDLYYGLQGRYDKCRADLLQLKQREAVTFTGGRPSRVRVNPERAEQLIRRRRALQEITAIGEENGDYA